MATKAVRYTQPLLGESVGTDGPLVTVPGVDSVTVLQDGVACPVYADNDKTTMTNPVPTGVAPGTAGVSTRGELLVYVEAGSGYGAAVVVGGITTIVHFPDISPDVTDVALPTNVLARANNLSELASAATARTNLGLGSAATQPSSAFAQLGAGVGYSFVAVGDEASERFDSWHWQAVVRSGGALTMPQYAHDDFVSLSSTAIVALLPHLLAPIPPHFVPVVVGRNDLPTAGSLPTFKANVASICSSALVAGSLPVICTLPPRSVADAQNTATFKSNLTAANAWLRTYAATNGYPLVDFYATVVNPATGSLLASYAAPSGVISTTGSAVMADAFIAVLTPRLRAITPIAATYDGDAASLVANGMLLADSNSDGVPDGWVAAAGGGFTPSIVTDTRFRGGKAWQLAMVNPTVLPAIYYVVSGSPVAAGGMVALCLSFSIESASGMSIEPEIAGFHIKLNAPGTMLLLDYVSQVTPKLVRYCGLVRFSSIAGIFDGHSLAPVFAFDGMTSAMSLTVRVGDIALFDLSGAGDVKGLVGIPSWLNTWSGSGTYYPLPASA